MTKRMRGGIQQRLSLAEPSGEAKQGQPKSCLADWLHRQWAEGFFSPQQLQKIAALAQVDFEASGARAPHPLAQLARLGSNGLYENNMHRDLVKLLAPVSSLPHALPVKIPMKGGLFLQNIQLPHLQFHCMHKHYTDRFNSSFFPEAPHSLRSFWETFSQHICMRDHPALGRPDLYSKGLPIKIHGNAMPVTGIGKAWSKGMLVMNWSGLLNKGASRENCHVMYVAVWQHILAEMHYISNLFQCIWGHMYLADVFLQYICKPAWPYICKVFEEEFVPGDLLECFFTTVQWTFYQSNKRGLSFRLLCNLFNIILCL